jgi:predicted tellurium resistance membrane protein TerC
MPGTAVGLFMMDFVFRPFAKIYEKMPLIMLLVLVVLYSAIGYMVLKSAYLSDHPN